MSLSVKKQEKSSTQQITDKPVNAIIHVWNAENSDFDVAASGSDIYVGYAYDKTSKTYKDATYGAVGSAMLETIKPGRYFVYVVLSKTSRAGSLAYSYTYVDVKEGQVLQISKTFSHDVASGAFEAWEKNK
jgi:hypothetical protein